MISTHTLTWSVTKRGLTCSEFTDNFNSHAHVERDRNGKRPCSLRSHFNSHAHVERDFTWENLPDTIDISTHTLTWSVTLHLLRLNCKNLHFNSHAHVERDISADVKTVNNFISTHTLTWSVTFVFPIKHGIYKFQLTRSRGA